MESRKRRTHKRKPHNSRSINVYDARREIVHFLRLHRSQPPPPPQPPTTVNFNLFTTNMSDRSIICCPVTDSLPLPGPVWSTTAPSLLPPPPPPPSSPIETLEIFENQSSSSYAWWFEFLQNLDCKKRSNSDDVLKYPTFEEIYRRNQSKEAFGEWQFSKLRDHTEDDADKSTPAPDEWLTVPPNEDQGY